MRISLGLTHWQALRGLIGPLSSKLQTSEAQLNSAQGRLEQVQAIDEWITHWSRHLSVDDAEQQLKGVNVPASRVYVGDELAAHKNLHANGFFPELPHERMGPKHYTGMPVIAVGAGRVSVNAPPMLGEHTAEILANLDAAILKTLTDEQVIGF